MSDVDKPEGTQDGATGWRRSRWRNLLIVSLALNLFLAGIIGAWALRPHFHRPPPPPSPANFTERLADRLPEADKPLLRDAFAKRRGDIDRLFDEVRKSQQAARAALRANPFDVGAYDAAAGHDRAARAALQDTIHAAMREAAVGMSPEGRTKLMPRRRPPG